MATPIYQFANSVHQPCFQSCQYLVSALVQDVVNVAQLLFDGGQSPFIDPSSCVSSSISRRGERAGLFTDLVGGVIPASMAITLGADVPTVASLSL